MKHLSFRRFFGRFHYLVNIALATLVLALLMVITVKENTIISFPGRPQAISKRAVSMLSALTGSVRAILILPHNNLFYNNVRQLLINMVSNAPNATFTLEFLDPHIDVSRAADAVRLYGQNGSCIIFEKDGRTEAIPFESLLERTHVDTDSLLPGSVVHTRFRGEQQIITALNRLARPYSPTIYAITGHGERDFFSYDRLTGYSDLAREIRREGYLLKTLFLDNGTSIPNPCDLIIIAGPQRPPHEWESDEIIKFLSRGGRLLFLFDRQSSIPNGWEEILSRVGITPANLTIINEGTLGGYNLSVDKFSNHSICRDLDKNSVTFSSPQVLMPNEETIQKYRLQSHIIVKAPGKSWGETDPNILPRRFDPGIDKKGDLPIAIAVDVSANRDLAIDYLRAVVVGDSNVGVNAFLGGGNTANRDLLLNAINWLTDNGMASSSSMESEGNALQLNFSLKRQIRFWMNSVVVWPAILCLLGAIIAFIKRLSA